MPKEMDYNAIDEIEKLRRSLHILKTSISVLSDEIVENNDFDYFVRNILTYSKGLAGAIELELKELVYSEFMKGNLDEFFKGTRFSSDFIKKMV